MRSIVNQGDTSLDEFTKIDTFIQGLQPFVANFAEILEFNGLDKA
jgi:hypothetical protein